MYKIDFESQILALFDTSLKKIWFSLTSLIHQVVKFNDFIWMQLIFSQKPF